MSKYIQMVLVLLYVLLTIFAFLIVLVLSGAHLSNVAGWWIIAGWITVCYGSASVRAGVRIFLRSKYRKPVLREEQRLAPAMDELLQQSGTNRQVRVWIETSCEWNACATGVRTISITDGLLKELTPSGLRGVLAHELGHLLSGDTIGAAAFMTAGLLPQGLFWAYHIGANIVRTAFVGTRAVGTMRGVMHIGRVNLLGGAVVTLILAWLLYRIHLLQAVIPVILFVAVFGILNRVFYFFRLLLMRLAEYRQDEFAFRLGHGEGLLQALQLLAETDEPVVNRYYIVMHSSHPVIYNRIRRLEKLLGWRT
ncbi:MAG TPA: M48 family metalloprotease [Puia sp.]|nr:M48 family metalloprotease [Puia sp.]